MPIHLLPVEDILLVGEIGGDLFYGAMLFSFLFSFPFLSVQYLVSIMITLCFREGAVILLASRGLEVFAKKQNTPFSACRGPFCAGSV